MKIKLKLLLLSLTVLLFACNESKQFVVKGTIDKEDSGLIYLKGNVDGDWVTVDSSNILNGTFQFDGAVEVPEVFILVGDVLGRGSLPLFVENSEIECNIKFDPAFEYKVSGSASHFEFDNFNKEFEGFQSIIDSLGRDYSMAQRAGDTIKMEELTSVYEQTEADRQDYVLNYALENPQSYVAPVMIWQYMGNYEVEDLDKVVANFSENVKKSNYSKQVIKVVETFKKTAIGQPAIDFEMESVNGEMIKLSSLYGSYLLVDFWASWCRPCRAENPNIVNNYNIYHEKGFDVLGVSFDDNREAWLAAVEKDSLTWTHVSDLKRWGNAAGKLYGVRSIPANVLLDHQGNIIAKNIRGEELSEKLLEIFGE